jgi:AcrR family transcriptional regulator
MLAFPEKPWYCIVTDRSLTVTAPDFVMTRDDVINAAFFVWGRELYKTTSLAKLADALGVSKPALYRHFPDKDALLEAMAGRFYDDYAAEIRPALEEALKAGFWQERFLIMVRFITAYFARHFDYFIYSLIRIHYSKKEKRRPFDGEEMKKRGVFFARLVEGMHVDREYPSVMLLSSVTALFGTALFHKEAIRRPKAGSSLPAGGGGGTRVSKQQELEKRLVYKPPEEDVRYFVDATVALVRRGLRFDRALIENLPYEKIEALSVPGEPYAPPDPLLKAVAQAVAEAGPWNASMETVATCSGLSKSGLYAHFKSKNDMLSRFFMTEFEHIAAIVAARSRLVEGRAEQLYLVLLSIAGYLQDRPEILIGLDWIRIQRLDLDLSVPSSLDNFFEGLNLGDISMEKSTTNISQWIPFLLVTVLMYCRPEFRHTRKFDGESPDKKPEEPPEEVTVRNLRKLFKFITLGVEGLTENVQP